MAEITKVKLRDRLGKAWIQYSMLVMLVLIVGYAVVGCAYPSEENVPVPVAVAETVTRTPTVIVLPSITHTWTPVPPTATSTVTCTPTPTLTFTPTSTPTQTPTPTFTATFTPTPMPCVMVVSESVNLRAGPGTIYDVVGGARAGDRLPLLARTKSGGWWQVDYGGRSAWVFASLVAANRDLSQVAVAAEIPATPTPTPTATPELILPGIYAFEDLCIEYYPMNDPAFLRWCVENVEVHPDGEMQVRVSWMADVLLSRYDRLIKEPDDGNTNMYLTDNLGNRYDFIDLGEDAKGHPHIFHHVKKYGWYLFPPAQPGAFSFTFHDDDQCIRGQPCLIENIVLR